MAWWCFSLVTCLVVVVVGSGDVLRAGSFSCARHVREKRFQRQAADLSNALYWCTREPVRSHHRASAARQRLGQEVQRLMADGVCEYALRAPDAVLLVPLPVAGGERGAWQEGPNLLRFLAPRETLVSSSCEVFSSDPPGRTVIRTRRSMARTAQRRCMCTTQERSFTMKIQASAVTLLTAVWRLSPMPWQRSWIACRSFGGSVDDMFSNIFSNDLTD